VSKRYIVIVEQNWGGHHPMYHAQFVIAAAVSGAQVLALSPFPEESKKLVESYGGRVERIDFRKTSFDLSTIPFSRKLPALYNQRLFQSVKADVKAAQIKNVEEVMFCCLFHGAYPFWRSLEKDFPYTWSALAIESNIFDSKRGVSEYVRDRAVNSIGIYQSGNCRSALSLEFEELDKIRHAVDCDVTYLPEIIDVDRWSIEELEKAHPQLKTITSPLVGVMGGLGPRKSLYELVKAAKLQEHREWGILAVGSFTEHVGYTAEQYTEILEFLENDPNSYCYFDRVSDGEYNAFIDRSAIAFLCYQNFTRSSNNLPKAAWAKKPSIVLPNGCLAQRTAKYNLGEVIDDLNPSTLQAAIQKSLAGETTHKFDQYLKEHCQTKASSLEDYFHRFSAESKVSTI